MEETVEQFSSSNGSVSTFHLMFEQVWDIKCFLFSASFSSYNKVANIHSHFLIKCKLKPYKISVEANLPKIKSNLPSLIYTYTSTHLEAGQILENLDGFYQSDLDVVN